MVTHLGQTDLNDLSPCLTPSYADNCDGNNSFARAAGFVFLKNMLQQHKKCSVSQKVSFQFCISFLRQPFIFRRPSPIAELASFLVLISQVLRLKAITTRILSHTTPLEWLLMVLHMTTRNFGSLYQNIGIICLQWSRVTCKSLKCFVSYRGCP